MKVLSLPKEEPLEPEFKDPPKTYKSQNYVIWKYYHFIKARLEEGLKSVKDYKELIENHIEIISIKPEAYVEQFRQKLAEDNIDLVLREVNILKLEQTKI